MDRELCSAVGWARRLCGDICFARNLVCYVFFFDSCIASSTNQLKPSRKKDERWKFLKGVQENLTESSSGPTAGSEEGTG